MSMRRRIHPLPLVVAGLVLLATACGDDGAGPGTLPPATGSAPPGSASAAPTTSAPSGGGVTAADLDGKEYLATDVTGHELVAGSEIRLMFDGDGIGALAGCNHMGSTWALEGDVLRVESMATTEMACTPAELMDQDTWLAGFLTGGPRIAVDGDTLTLTSADGGTVITLLDREVAEPDAELEGVTWVLESLVSGDAVSSVPAGIRVPTLDFVDGDVAVSTGCNTGSAGYEVGDGTITFTPLTMTRMACTDDAAAEVEAAIVAALDGSPTFEIDADRLTLTNGDSGLVLRAEQAGGQAGG